MTRRVSAWRKTACWTSPNARAGSQTWPKRRRTARSCTARSASGTPAGQRTANRTISTPTPMCPRTAKSRWYTTASLKTIWRSGNFSRRRVYSSHRKRTARSSRSCWNIAWGSTRYTACRTRSTWCCTASRARTPSASSAQTILSGCMRRERTRRCFWATATAATSSPLT